VPWFLDALERVEPEVDELDEVAVYPPWAAELTALGGAPQ
jgi:hypothetical protein